MYSLKLVLFDLVSLGFGAVFLQILFVISKKQKQEWIRFAHRAIFARFARSRGNFQHENIDFLGFKLFKSGFSEGRGSNIASSLVDTRSVKPCIV